MPPPEKAGQRSGLAKAAGVLASGTLLGQIVLIASSPILTRIYSTSDIGILGIFNTIVGLVGYLGSLKYEMAIPLATNPWILRSVVRISLTLLIFVSSTAGFLFYFSWNYFSVLLQIDDSRFLIWCIPAGVLLVGLIEICQNIALLDKAYFRVARSEVTQNVASVAAQLGLAVLWMFSGSIIIGQLVGKIAGAASILGVLRRPMVAGPATGDHGVASVANLYRDFPLYAAPSGFVSFAGRQLPVLLLAIFFGPAVVGMYALGQRVLTLPMNSLGLALLRTVLSVAPMASREGTLRELIENVFLALLMLSVPSLCLLSLIAPELFALVFGENWRQAGEYVPWLIPWTIVIFISLPLSVVIRIHAKQKEEFAFQVLLAVARVLALCVGGYLIPGPTATIGLFGLVSAVLNGAFMFWMLSLVGIGVRPTLVAIVRELLLSLPFLLPVLAVWFWGPQEGSMFLTLGTAALSASALWLVSAMRIKAQVGRDGGSWLTAPRIDP